MALASLDAHIRSTSGDLTDDLSEFLISEIEPGNYRHECRKSQGEHHSGKSKKPDSANDVYEFFCKSKAKGCVSSNSQDLNGVLSEFLISEIEPGEC